MSSNYPDNRAYNDLLKSLSNSLTSGEMKKLKQFYGVSTDKTIWGALEEIGLCPYNISLLKIIFINQIKKPKLVAVIDNYDKNSKERVNNATVRYNEYEKEMLKSGNENMAQELTMELIGNQEY